MPFTSTVRMGLAALTLSAGISQAATLVISSVTTSGTGQNLTLTSITSGANALGTETLIASTVANATAGDERLWGLLPATLKL